MKVLTLSREVVARLLRMDGCMEAMAGALKTLSRGDGINPLRDVVRLPDDGYLMVMPGYLGDPGVMAVKSVSGFPENHAAGFETHQGAIVLFEGNHGRLLALIDAQEITAVRTAAVSGVATQVLARDDAVDLALIGCGVQAHTHLNAMRIARDIRRVRVWSRTPERAKSFAESSEDHIEVMSTVQEAVEGADLICTLTGSQKPILEGTWVSPGAHINAVGASSPTGRELDTDLVKRAEFFVDRRESTFHESGDFLIPKNEGEITDEHIRGELGELLLGEVEGRKTDEDITLFKSLGLAVEDVAAAHYVFQKAMDSGEGIWVEL